MGWVGWVWGVRARVGVGAGRGGGESGGGVWGECAHCHAWS